jgi:hypothetical protein
MVMQPVQTLPVCNSDEIRICPFVIFLLDFDLQTLGGTAFTLTL